jgi:hypothetical protein
MMEEEDGDVRVPMEWEVDGGVKVLVEEKNGDVRVPVEEFKLRFLVTVVSSVGGSDEAMSFGSSASLLGAIPS